MSKILNAFVLVALLASVVETAHPYVVEAANYTGVKFKVGVIDTGIDYNHQYLGDNVEDGCSKNFITNTSGRAAADDNDGHGTRVAGLIGAKLNPSNGMQGMNPKAQLCSLKVFETVPDRFSAIAAENLIVDAINYAAEKGIRLINMSWGSYVNSEAIRNAIRNNPNILFVAASGDSNIDESQLEGFPGVNRINFFNNNDLKPFYPASYGFLNIISVTSHDHHNMLWANYGTTSVDLAALGYNVRSTEMNDSYIHGLDGTYTSAAFVTGAASYYWGSNSAESGSLVKSKILASTDKTRFMAVATLSSGILNLNNLLSNNFASVIAE